MVKIFIGLIGVSVNREGFLFKVYILKNNYADALSFSPSPLSLSLPPSLPLFLSLSVVPSSIPAAKFPDYVKQMQSDRDVKFEAEYKASISLSAQSLVQFIFTLT